MFRDFSFIADQIGDTEAVTFMASFQLAYDGSGTFGQHTAVSYGGVVASTKQWAAFAEEWQEVLAGIGLRYFKMAEAMKWYGAFQAKYSEWGDNRDARRDALLDRLTDLSVRYGFKATGMWADPRIVGDHKKTAHKKEELFKGAVYTFLESVPRDAHVTMLCDEELDIEPQIRQWVRQMRRDHGDKVAPIVAVCFADDRVFPAIQLADMVAWLFRDLGERFIANSNDQRLNPFLKKLAWGTDLSVHQTPKGQLLSGLEQHGRPIVE